MKPLRAAWMGRIPYADAFAMQRALAAHVAAGDAPETLLLLEHDAVYTLGRRGTESEILLSDEALRERGIAVEYSDRGGRVTYHGPGQLVGYPIIDLGLTGDMVAYVRSIERAMVALAATFGVPAGVVPGMTGVWVGNAKIGAIGVHVSRGITTHGFAFNVSPDLSAFNGIIPCGIADRGVTSLAELGIQAPPVEEVALATAPLLASEVGRRLEVVDRSVVAEEIRVEA